MDHRRDSHGIGRHGLKACTLVAGINTMSGQDLSGIRTFLRSGDAKILYTSIKTLPMQISSHSQACPIPHSQVLDAAALLQTAIADFDSDLQTARLRIVRAAALLGIKGAQEAPETPSRARPTAGLSRRVARLVTEYIGQSMDEVVRVSSLAAMAGVSTSRFCRAFKVTFGTSAHAYLTDIRLERAKELMTSSPLTLSQIAIECGFCDQSHLSNRFRDRFGATPRQWRLAQSS
jgi:AraC family transcriptional regulator